MKKVIIFILMINSIISFAESKFKTGLDVFLEKEFFKYSGKNIGIITNATGVTIDGVQNVDAIIEKKEIKLIKLFGPEHGIRGDIAAGTKVEDMVDKKSGLPVYSLYGATRRPTKEMLKGIDVLIYDIQDIGSRSYTFISTMAYCMQEAAKENIEFVVLDRPIPIYGEIVDGNILESEYSSFIGVYPIPYVYGMTPGELALYFNKEFGINCKLTVIKMEGYSHKMSFKETKMKWIPPSPNIPRYESAYYYPATGIMGELGTTSGGAGLGMLFELLGDEGIDGNKITNYLNNKNILGITFKNVEFIPKTGKYKDKKCSGIKLEVTDEKKYLPFATAIYIMEAFIKCYPEKNYLGTAENVGKKDMFEKAMGTAKIRKMLLEGKSAEEVINSYKKELDEFKKKREKYLLY